MGTTGDRDGRLCQRCGRPGPNVRSRGRIDLIAELCEDCWNRLANRMALDEGATALPRPELGPDTMTFVEPLTCERCGSDIRIRPTVYDRWVSLATAELPAKDVPPHFRWRLVHLRSPRSPVVIDVVAVRVRGIDPLPGEAVTPAHRMFCAAEEAESSPVSARGSGLPPAARALRRSSAPVTALSLPLRVDHGRKRNGL
ncbi:DUF6083 domain-containing protein [Streptomyces sp. NPDC088766]|uniref:DUF6083 domain-containing protein n=1 Tax=Streptomyces sp. NPDC088766 TaxID=3365893 RepID=UPI0037F52E39